MWVRLNLSLATLLERLFSFRDTVRPPAERPMIGPPNFTFRPKFTVRDKVSLGSSCCISGPTLRQSLSFFHPVSVLLRREVLKSSISPSSVDGPFSLLLMDRYRGYVSSPSNFETV